MSTVRTLSHLPKFPTLAGLALGASLLTPATALADTWDVDTAHTHVGFSVSHMMIATVRGEFGTFEGTAETDASGKLKAIQGTVDVSSVDTREPKRDEHLRSPDFFDVATHPHMTFVSKKVTPKGKGYSVAGDLTIRGVTKPVIFELDALRGPITDPWGNVKVGGTMVTTIDRQDFGVSWNNNLDAGGVVVGDDVTIRLELELTKKK